MPTIFRAYKYRVYPDKVQSEFLDRNFGAVRFLWNQFVSSFNGYDKGPVLPENEKILKDRHLWMHDCISYALQQKRMDWVEFKKQYFSKNRKVKLGRPAYKKRGVSNDSFRIPGVKVKVDIESGTIKIPKMTILKVVYDRKFDGQIRSVTLSKNRCNQYFVSILVEETIEVKQNTGCSIGIDLGLKHLCILSNGIKIDNPRWFRETQAKLKRAHQHLSRKTKGSNRREKQRLKVAKLHLKVVNQRKDFQHNFSSWLVNNFDTIITEDLNVKCMIKNRRMAKSISDASWSSLIDMIKYKSNWYGRAFHKIDRWYPSSKTCSSCGYKETNMGLHVRNWNCTNCGTIHDRDLNAALNILRKGLDDLYGVSSEELSDYRRGEGLRPEALAPKAPSLNRLVSFIEFDRTT